MSEGCDGTCSRVIYALALPVVYISKGIYRVGTSGPNAPGKWRAERVSQVLCIVLQSVAVCRSSVSLAREPPFRAQTILFFPGPKADRQWLAAGEERCSLFQRSQRLALLRRK